MAIKFIEGFDHYTNFATQYHGKWSNIIGNTALTVGRCTGKALIVNERVIHPIKNPESSFLILGAAVYHTNFNYIYAGSRPIFGFLSLGTNDYMGAICVNMEGQLFFQRTVNGTYGVHAGTSDNIVINRWHYIECELYSIADGLEGTGNYAKIYIDGVLVGEEHDFAMGDVHWAGSSNRFAAFAINGPGSFGDETIYDDLYYMDNTEPGKITPLGDQSVKTVFPTADVYKDFVPSAGAANWEMVNEAGADEDVTYNEGANVGDKDIFEKEAISGISGWNINAIQVSARTRKIDIGNRLISPFVKSGATESAKIQQSIASDYRYRYQVFEKNPDGDVDWTDVTMNAADIAYQAD